MTKKQLALLERLAPGRRLLPAQIDDVPSARKLLQLGYAELVDDKSVRDWSRPGGPLAKVLVITDDGRAALASK